MSELIITLLLVGFVVGGGVFIFWPDLTSFIKKPAREKKKKNKLDSVNDIYRNNYSKEDEFIESATMSGAANKTMEQMKVAIQKRSEKIKKMMIDPVHNQHECPVCGGYNQVKYDSISIHCQCNHGKFRKAANQMMEDAGHKIW
jgi:hypothetical protein